jgi:acetyl esterase/lipase
MTALRLVGVLAAAIGCVAADMREPAGAEAPAQVWTAQNLLELPQPPYDRRLAYGPDPRQFGHLRLPPGAGPHPIAVLLHGGCWRSQFDLRHLSSAAATLTSRGMATWNVEYRRVGSDGGWPGTFQDVGQAVDFVRELARSAPIDSSRTVLVGHSAGGHLALWAAGRHRLPEGSPLRRGDPLAVRGVVALAPVADLSAAAAASICGDAIPRLLGGAAADVPDRYRQASPIQLLPLGVPQRLIAGADDTIVPLALIEAYADRSRAAGDATTLTSLRGMGHFELVGPMTDAWPEVERAVLELHGSLGPQAR